MRNPNSYLNRIKRFFLKRWSDQDTPASEPRFYINLLIKDIVIFIALPLSTALLFKILDGGVNSRPNRNKMKKEVADKDFKSIQEKSQIIEFTRGKNNIKRIISKKDPGTLIKVRLLNAVETFGNAPVHAQIIDNGLGSKWIGGTLIGEAISDQNYDRINISFRFVKSEFRIGLAQTIKARALSLNGTLGISAEKKEGFFARSALNASTITAQEVEKGQDNLDIKHFLAKALANGLLQEFGTSVNSEKVKSQVYTLNPGEVFFVELTDFFPGDH